MEFTFTLKVETRDNATDVQNDTIHDRVRGFASDLASDPRVSKLSLLLGDATLVGEEPNEGDEE